MENIIIPNPELLKKKITAIKKDGKESIHVLSDFDRTLTKAFFNGEKIPGILSHIDKGNYLKGYSEKAIEIFNKYHPIEISSEIKYEEKSKIMLEWWSKVYKLLVESGLNEKVIKKAVTDIIQEGKVRLREGCELFLKNTNDSKIPIIIMSATGIGNMVTEFLKEKRLMFDNIHFIGNTLKFDKKGNFLGIKDDKIIHILNKHEIEIKGLPIYKNLLKRKNVILLGDSLDDLGMAQGVQHANIIKIGFFNYPGQNLEEFKKSFDIIITNDGDFSEVNKILEQII